MLSPTPTQIKEIAEQLDCGFCCYYNTKTGEIISIPDFEDSISDFEEFYGEELAKIKKDKKNYVIITKPSSREGFEIMENFIDEVEDIKLRDELSNALNKKKPFSHFKFIVENSAYRQTWFDFKAEQIQRLVIEQMPMNS